MTRLVASFSGGETSALMTYLLLTRWRTRYDEIVVVFANTGEENEQTLEFVRRCDEAFSFNTVWVEAVVNPSPNKGTTHRAVDFLSASRRGEPYEDFVRKYGIPNMKFPQCTRELKGRPIRDWIRSNGWGTDYDIAIGIRADEAPRKTGATSSGGRVVYPLCDWEPMTKPDVNTFWRDQPFRLDLLGYQGNCKWCWKKSTRKLLTIMDENPTAFEFPERLEREYGTVGPEFAKEQRAGYHRVFFRGSLSVRDLRNLHAAGDWTRAENDAVVYSDKRVALDQDDGCVESCELNTEDLL